MQPSFIESPLIQSIPLSDYLNKEIYLKLECLQPSGSFKDRGVGHLCSFLAQQGAKGFVSSSGGNAGMAVAYAAKRLQLPAFIIVPKTTSALMVNKLRATKAEIIIHGENWNEADELAQLRGKELNLDYIPPFNHPKIWEGYELIASEIQPKIKPDAFILSVGGGGLLSGMIQGLQKIGWKDVPIITAETQGAASLATALKQHKHITLDRIDTIATTLGAKQVAARAFELSQEFKVYPQVVSDSDAIRACLHFANQHRLLVEPACGASLSVAYQNLDILKDYQKICIIICGGNGVNCQLLHQWQEQFNITL